MLVEFFNGSAPIYPACIFVHAAVGSASTSLCGWVAAEESIDKEDDAPPSPRSSEGFDLRDKDSGWESGGFYFAR